MTSTRSSTSTSPRSIRRRSGSRSRGSSTGLDNSPWTSCAVWAVPDVDAGYECSGNSRRVIHGLASNGRWTGVPLRILLDRVSVRPEAREFVFRGADKGPESVDFRGLAYEVEQHFARSLSRADGLASEPLLAYALNGEPLTREPPAPIFLRRVQGHGTGGLRRVESRVPVVSCSDDMVST